MLVRCQQCCCGWRWWAAEHSLAAGVLRVTPFVGWVGVRPQQQQFQLLSSACVVAGARCQQPQGSNRHSRQ